MALHIQPHDKDKAANYLKTVRMLFAMRRKTLVSNLRQGCDMSREAAFAVLDAVNIDQNARAETLSVSDMIKLSEIIENL